MSAEELLRGFPIPKGTVLRMTRWRLTVEYDGGPFMGWQRQDHGPSVQETLEQAMFRMTGELATCMPPAGPMPAFMRWR